MNIDTSRFGAMDIDADRIIEFPEGLLGFTGEKRFILLQPDENGVFLWLQSVDTPELAFVVTDPALWSNEYQVKLRREQMNELDLSGIENASVFVIVNKCDQTLTANMQGPIVINTVNRRGAQIVLVEKQWTTQHELIVLDTPASAAA